MGEHPFTAIRAVEQAMKKRLRQAQAAAHERRELARVEAREHLATVTRRAESALVSSEREAELAAELDALDRELGAVEVEAAAHHDAVVEAMLLAITGEDE